MKKGLISKAMLGGLASLTIIASAGEYSGEIYKGKIIKTSFFPSQSFFTSDRFNALINIGKNTVVTNTLYNTEAREANLKYNEGDSIIVQRYVVGDKTYWLMKGEASNKEKKSSIEDEFEDKFRK